MPTEEQINELIDSSLSSHDAGWRVLKAVLVEFSPMSLPGILNMLGHLGSFSGEEEEILHEAWRRVIAADEAHDDTGWTWSKDNDER